MSKQIDLRDAFRIVLATIDGRLTREERAKVFGELEFRSCNELARYAGVAPATVRHTWKPNGLPAESRRGSGSKINAAAVLDWIESRNRKNAQARGRDEFTDRKRDAETRAVEAEARIKERKAEVIEGQHISIEVAISFVRGAANLLRDGLMGVARKIEPIFPARDAKKYVAEVEREHRNLLVTFAETPINDIRRAAEGGGGIDDL